VKPEIIRLQRMMRGHSSCKIVLCCKRKCLPQALSEDPKATIVPLLSGTKCPAVGRTVWVTKYAVAECLSLCIRHTNVANQAGACMKVCLSHHHKTWFDPTPINGEKDEDNSGVRRCKQLCPGQNDQHQRWLPPF